MLSQSLTWLKQTSLIEQQPQVGRFMRPAKEQDMNNIEDMSAGDLVAEMQGYLNGKPKQSWDWIGYTDKVIREVTFSADGSVCSSSDSDEITTLRALVTANRRVKQRRSKAAKKAAATRTRRRELKLARVVQRWEDTGLLPGPRYSCALCGRGVTDPESIKRGIGPECWQDVLKLTQRGLETALAVQS